MRNSIKAILITAVFIHLCYGFVLGQIRDEVVTKVQEKEAFKQARQIQ